MKSDDEEPLLLEEVVKKEPEVKGEIPEVPAPAPPVESTAPIPPVESIVPRNWERVLPKKTLREGVTLILVGALKGLQGIFRSRFMLTCLCAFLSAILFGMDIMVWRFGYAAVHAAIGIFLIRCVQLMYTSAKRMGSDDDVLNRLTGQKG